MRSRPELPELKGLMMADLLEEKAVEDVDRNIDNCSFLRDQFDIFKHDYREAFDAHGHETLANLSLNPELKKEVVTMMRQLQKAKIKIGSYTHFQGKDREVMDDLLQKISEVQKELERVSHGKTDFTIRNVELPEFDEDAIKALFGSENPNIKESNAKQTLEKLCDFNRIFAEKVSSVLGAATLLLTGYKEIEDYVKYLESK